ncbi:MAG: hypothetical protein NTY19_35915 [Planctomycetota bacterium]|nr:hypothetical protein [Planctomycetota bacterium]
MSSTGNPVPFVWLIQKNPQDTNSIHVLPVTDSELGVLLFTQREYAEQFASESTDLSRAAAVTAVEVTRLESLLRQLQSKAGCTHVVTDPIIGSHSYLDHKTLTVDEYIRRLRG